MGTLLYSIIISLLPRMWNDEVSSTQETFNEQVNLLDIEMEENYSDEDFPGQCICGNCNFVV